MNNANDVLQVMKEFKEEVWRSVVSEEFEQDVSKVARALPNFEISRVYNHICFLGKFKGESQMCEIRVHRTNIEMDLFSDSDIHMRSSFEGNGRVDRVIKFAQTLGE